MSGSADFCGGDMTWHLPCCCKACGGAWGWEAVVARHASWHCVASFVDLCSTLHPLFPFRDSHLVRAPAVHTRLAWPAGVTTPSEVAERIIDFLLQLNPLAAWFVAWSADDIRRQAAESSERYAPPHARLYCMRGVFPPPPLTFPCSWQL